MSGFLTSVKITTMSGKEYLKDFDPNHETESVDELITNEFFNSDGYITLDTPESSITYLRKDRIESVSVYENESGKYYDDNDGIAFDTIDF